MIVFDNLSLITRDTSKPYYVVYKISYNLTKCVLSQNNKKLPLNNILRLSKKIRND